MKKSVLFLALAVGWTVVSLAASESKKVPKTPEEHARRIYERTGGFVPAPTTQKGRIVYVNRQTRIPVSDLNGAILAIQHDAKFNFVIGKEGDKGDITIDIIDNADAKTLLVAPEDGWAQVNVAGLMAGLKTEGAIKKFLPSRVRKEMMRAFAYACGCGGTQFPGNVLAISKVQDLDYCEEFLPMDAVTALIDRLGKRGITPLQMATYRRACYEGWAASPTDDVQRVIVEKVKVCKEKERQKAADAKK